MTNKQPIWKAYYSVGSTTDYKYFYSDNELVLFKQAVKTNNELFGLQIKINAIVSQGEKYFGRDF